MSKQYKNIFVHNMVNLGDVVASTSCLPILKKAYPDARITMMVRPKIADILQNHPCVDEVIEYDYRGKSDRLTMFTMAKIVKAKNFDLSIALDRKLRMAIITWLAGIKERIGPNKVFYEKPSLCTKLYTQTINLPYNIHNVHQSQIYQDIIAIFTGLTDLSGQFKPYISSAPILNQENARRILQSTGKKKNIILCVKAEFALKNWLPEYWSELFRKIEKKYPEVGMLIVGMPSDREYAKQIIDQSGVSVLNLCGKTSMLDLVALYEQSDFGIVLDNGSAHIAAAVNTKLISIFGPISPAKASPLTDICELLTLNMPCMPCFKKEDECPEHECMRNITSDMVMQRVNKMWAMI